MILSNIFCFSFKDINLLEVVDLFASTLVVERIDSESSSNINSIDK